MLFDGHSLLYRSYYALLHANLTNSYGAETGAITGFLNTLAKVIRENKPDGFAVAFDLAYPTFRHEISEDYKKGRPETPDSLIDQVERVIDLLKQMNISVLSAEGFEADDLLATVAKELAENNHSVIIVTGDRDMFQLVQDPLIKVLYISTGKKEPELFDEQAVFKKIGVLPKAYPLYLALKGDPSDAIKGVPSIGQKTAASIVNQYDSYEILIENLKNLNPKLAKTINEHIDSIKEDLTLSTLRYDVPVKIDTQDLNVKKIDLDKGAVVVADLGINRAWQAFLAAIKECLVKQQVADPGLFDETGQDEEVAKSKKVIELSPNEIELVKNADLVFVIYFEADELIALKSIKGTQELVFKISVSELDKATEDLKDSLLKAPIVTHQAKEFIKLFISKLKAKPNVIFDTDLALYLIDPEMGNKDLDEIPKLNFLKGFESAVDKMSKLKALYGNLKELILAYNVEKLFYEIELPLLYVLSKMELAGILVDQKVLKEILTDLQKKLKITETRIFELVGKEFNINSTKELQNVLFNYLKLNPVRKIKTGYSTDQKTLLMLANSHPVIPEILKYRELEKLRSTYGEPLFNYIGNDGRIHARFIQTSTRTGRIASENPNLQNIPIRSQEGEVFRKAFIAKEGFELLIADYNQIELRVIAHLTEDENLLDALLSGTDVHSEIAAKVFKIPLSQVTETLRSKAKMVSYGLAYGMEPYGLSQRLGIDVKEAEEIIKSYFDAFPKVRSYMREAIEQAKKTGFTQTLLGRKRYFRELSSKDFRLRSQAERAAINAPIQGLAADIFKKALVELDKALEKDFNSCQIVLQVHDEILIEVPIDLVKKLTPIVSEIMRNAFVLKVPLEVNVSHGKNWLEAKKSK